MRSHASSWRILGCLALALSALHVGATRADALELLCDSSYETSACRKEILNRIGAELSSIEVGTWFFEDRLFTDALIARWRAGVPVRVIADPDSNHQHPMRMVDQL